MQDRRDMADDGDMRAAERSGTALAALSDLRWRLWDEIAGPSGWRSLIGPVAFVVAGMGLLVYDHLNDRVTDVVFWLTLGLIFTVFARVLETNRRQSRELAERERKALNDPVTALPNRRQLAADIEAMRTKPNARRILVLFELEGLEAYGDHVGYAAGDELLCRAAECLVEAVAPLHGTVYRFGPTRLSFRTANDRPAS